MFVFVVFLGRGVACYIPLSSFQQFGQLKLDSDLVDCLSNMLAP
jgi:hypothetical protein